MNCKDITRFLAQTIDGGAAKHGHLTTAEMAALVVHMRGCPSCRRASKEVVLFFQNTMNQADIDTISATIPALKERLLSDPETAAMLDHRFGADQEKP